MLPGRSYKRATYAEICGEGRERERERELFAVDERRDGARRGRKTLMMMVMACPSLHCLPTVKYISYCCQGQYIE